MRGGCATWLRTREPSIAESASPAASQRQQIRIASGAVGHDYTTDQPRTIANRIVTCTHEINRRRGFGPEKESFGPWNTQRPIVAADGEELRTTAEESETMRREYHEARGWKEPPACEM